MANDEFQRLLGIVAQLNGQLSVMTGMLNDLSGRQAAQNTSPLRNMVTAMEADIKRLRILRDEAAATAFKAIDRPTPSQPRVGVTTPAATEQPTTSSGRPYGPLAREIDKIQATKLAMEKAGLDAANREIDKIQEAIARGAERALARKTAPISPGLRAAADRFLAKQGLVTNIPNADTGSEYGTPYPADFGKGPLPARTTFSPWETWKKGPTPFDNMNKKELTAAEAAAKAEEELVKTLRQRIGAETRYRTALELATKQGFSLEDLKKVTTKGTGGIEQLRFEKRDATTDGIRQELDVFNTPAGKSTAGLSNQFRTFGQGVVRDIGELTKWSLALAAVYGPLNKLKELTQTMIENQTKLAEATISVNSSLLDQSAVFDIAAKAADRAGESIGGVIDAFTQAYRATGGTGTQEERLITANKLLADSLVLAKLSTLDQASAIDTLSAALRQSGDSLGGSNIALQNGTLLLDKWVRVTKIANVDLTSLATGFAVLGDSAEAAGIDADHLNGIIATISETGISTGKETANIARALVGNFQTDAAEKALNQIGISARTATGEMRPLLDVMQEISDQRKQGLLDDQTFSKLTQTIGQGVRRGASTATFLENFSRVGQVAQESARANGDAQAALDKQLATVATSITKLGNAFDKLAQTLGTDSGFLGIITSAIDGMTGLVNAFDGLISLLGKATPAMIAFGAASAFLKYRGIGGGLAGQVQGLGTSMRGTYQPGAQLSLPGFGMENAGKSPASRWIGTNVLGTNAMSGGFQGLAMSLAPLLQNAFNKEDRFGGTKAIADAAGGIVGGIVGSLAGPGGTLVGATIGISIAEAFVNAITAERTLYDYAKGPRVVGSTGPGAVTDPEQRLKDAEIQLYKDIGGGVELIGRAITKTGTQEKIVEELNKAIADGNQKAIDSILNSSAMTGQGGITGRQALNNVGITNEIIDKAISGRTTDEKGNVKYNQLEFNPEYYAFNNPRVKDETKQAYLDALKTLNETGQGEGGEFSAFTQKQVANKGTFSNLINTITEELSKEISQKRITGDLKGTEYARQTKALSGFDETAVQFYAGFGEEFKDIIGSDADVFEAFSNIIVNGADESKNELIALNSEIGTLINQLSDPTLQGEKTFDLGGDALTRADAEARLASNKLIAANLASDINKEVIVNKLQASIPNIVGDINKPLPLQEEALVEQRTKQLEDSFYKGFLKLPDSMYQALLESFDAFAVPVKEFEDSVAGFKEITNTDAQMRQTAIAQLMEEGKLKSQKQDVFGIQQVDLPGSQAEALRQEVKNQEAYLAKNFPQYKQKPEDLGIIFNDYVTATLHGDNLAVKLALEKLIDINQKQLDGQYNIPEGATFWVPLTAAYYRNKGGGENMDSGTAANTSATEQNTSAINGLTSAMARETSMKYTTGFEAKAATMNDRLEASGILPKAPVSKYWESEKFGAPVSYDPTKDPNSKYTRSEKFGATATPEPTSFIDSLIRGIMGMFKGFTGGSMLGGQNIQNPQSLKSAAGIGQANANPTPVTKLDIKLSSSTVLNLDGRILANAMQNYLAQDLLRTDATQGTITKRYVI